MLVTLKNKFHNTTIRIRGKWDDNFIVPPKSSLKKLCGFKDCRCMPAMLEVEQGWSFYPLLDGGIALRRDGVPVSELIYRRK